MSESKHIWKRIGEFMNKKVLFFILCLGLFLTSVFVTYRSYAAFTSGVTGTATLKTAHWSFTADGESSTFTTNLGDLHPGVENSYSVRLSAVGSDVDVDYTITFGSPHDIPANLKFYRDSAKQIEISLNGGTVSGTIQARTESVITIYFAWPYGSTVEQYVPGEPWFNMTMVGRQTDPRGGV